MINKKNLLGKTPEDLGIKDAIHTAIVSVRAGEPIKPGQRCGMNKDREAVVNEKGCGVADPWRKETILRGQSFWLILNQDEVPNVQHVWEHPKVDFTPPEKTATQNKALAEIAGTLGVTYDQLMKAAAKVAETLEPVKYPGTLTAEQLETAWEEEVDSYKLWDEWSNESCHEFDDIGSACCPEPCYPECELFESPEGDA